MLRIAYALLRLALAPVWPVKPRSRPHGEDGWYELAYPFYVVVGVLVFMLILAAL